MNSSRPEGSMHDDHPSLRVHQLIESGLGKQVALDRVLGKGKYQKLASELYEELRLKQLAAFTAKELKAAK